MKKELQTQSSQNALNEINLVNVEKQICTKEQVINALQHHIRYLASFDEPPHQIVTINVTN